VITFSKNTVLDRLTELASLVSKASKRGEERSCDERCWIMKRELHEKTKKTAVMKERT
jgi:hypothetical protein